MITTAAIALALIAPNTATPDQIASFYAGKTVTVETRDLGGRLGTTGAPGGNQIALSPEASRSLDQLAHHVLEVADTVGLATLIHEALHTRGAETTENQRGPEGFFGWDDEWQAHQLSWNLVPDALQRFYGIPMGSDLGERYQTAARAAGYGTLGSPTAAGDSGADLLGNRTCWLA